MIKQIVNKDTAAGRHPRPTLVLAATHACVASLQICTLLPSLSGYITSRELGASGVELFGAVSVSHVGLLLWCIGLYAVAALLSRSLCSGLAACGVPFRWLFIMLCGAGATGGTMYASAGAGAAAAPYLILGAHACCGLAAGASGLANTYVVYALPDPAAQLNIHATSEALGYILGPSLVLLARHHKSESGVIDAWGSVGLCLVAFFAALGLLTLALAEPARPAHLNADGDGWSASEVCGWMLSSAVDLALAFAFGIALWSLIVTLPIISLFPPSETARAVPTFFIALGCSMVCGHVGMACVARLYDVPAGMLGLLATILLLAHDFIVVLAGQHTAMPPLAASPMSFGLWAALCFFAYGMMREACTRSALQATDGEDPAFVIGALGFLDSVGFCAAPLLVASCLPSRALLGSGSDGADGLHAFAETRQLLQGPTCALLVAVAVREYFVQCTGPRARWFRRHRELRGMV